MAKMNLYNKSRWFTYPMLLLAINNTINSISKHEGWWIVVHICCALVFAYDAYKIETTDNNKQGE